MSNQLITTGNGDDYTCPEGTEHDYKLDNLDGFTLTVPTPPNGWEINAVIIKIGGPGGGQHLTYSNPAPGSVIDVSYQQHEISHAHVCKVQTKETTTTTEATTTTTVAETTTTTVAETTTTTGETTTTTPEICPDIDGINQYPQDYSADPECGPVDPCVGINPDTGLGTTLWGVQECGTPTTTATVATTAPPAGTDQQLPATGLEGGFLTAAIIVTALGSGIAGVAKLARR